MKIETMDDWNGVLAGCGCCGMPACPVPVKECEGKSGSATKYGWAPYVKPDGADTDLIPTLYQDWGNPNRVTYLGTAALYNGWWYNSGAGNYFESLQVLNVNDSFSSETGSVYNSTNTTTGNTADDDTFTPATPADTTSNNPYGSQYFFYYFLASVLTYTGFTPTVTTVFSITSQKHTKTETSRYESGGSLPALQGAGGTADLFIHYADVTETALNEMALDDPFSLADMVAAAKDDAESEGWVPSASCSSTTNLPSWPLIGDPDYDLLTLDDDGHNNAYPPNWFASFAETGIVLTRFRWVIPETWEGSWFKITWDIAFFPDGYDAEDAGSPQPVAVLTDQTWEWTGPGDPEDADSWKSGWYEIAPPEEPGETRVVNVRFECYKSARFGVKPEVTGEAVEYPPPP